METTTEDSSNPYRLRTETEQTETTETISWDEFFRAVEENGLVIVVHEDDYTNPMDVIDREQAVNHASVETSELENRLLAGETVTSEVTETAVIERTVIEHTTIESEIIDTEILDSRVVDVELQSREIGGCDVIDKDVFDEVDHSRFNDMSQMSEGLQESLPRPVGVEVDVTEDYSLTRELLERATVESRIVDVNVTETDEVESEAVQSSLELESVQQALLESDVIETQADPNEIIESGTIESEFHENDTVRTHINQRRLVEDEFTEEKIVRGTLTESEVSHIEERGSTSKETAFVDGDSLDNLESPVGTTNYDTETGTADTATNADAKPRVTEDEEGKPVVDSDGNSMGMVEEVSNGTAFIDPEPGLVDRIRARLGRGNADEEDYALTSEHIERISDDEIELSDPK